MEDHEPFSRHITQPEVLKNTFFRAGEMAQWVRAPNCSSVGPEFKSQQPHGGSQLSIMRSDALFVASEDSYSVLRYYNNNK